MAFNAHEHLWLEIDKDECGVVGGEVLEEIGWHGVFPLGPEFFLAEALQA
jgi:hypothetical protein